MHFLPSTADITQAIRLGMGWGLNPTSLFQEDFETGTLVPLDETPFLIPLYWQTARLSKDALAPLTRALKRAAKATLSQS